MNGSCNCPECMHARLLNETEPHSASVALPRVGEPHLSDDQVYDTSELMQPLVVQDLRAEPDQRDAESASVALSPYEQVMEGMREAAVAGLKTRFENVAKDFQETIATRRLLGVDLRCQRAIVLGDMHCSCDGCAQYRTRPPVEDGSPEAIARYGRWFNAGAYQPVTREQLNEAERLAALGTLLTENDTPVRVLPDGAVEPIVVEPDQTDLGASDDRPCGPDSPIYRQGS